jgi:uncharacterized protein (TIGR01777 family)
MAMRIAISGINGFIGSQLKAAMQEKGWEVIPVLRKDFAMDSFLLGIKLSGADALINLAGAPIVHRWNKAYKRELRSSRISTTRKLVEAMNSANEKPTLFISTSAIGIYAAEGKHTELNYKPAGDFIGQLCRDWETEADAASSFTRTVIFRLGIVLAKEGGAFPMMMLPFKLGFGGKIGNGKQGFSWIHIRDLVAAYFFAIENSALNGVFNLTSPEPSDNSIFTRTLASIMHRPAFFTVPEFALKIIYGEGETAVAGGQMVLPERLLKAGFQYDFPTLEGALNDVLKVD